MRLYIYISLFLLTSFLSNAQLGDYYYSNSHPKAKGLNFQIQGPSDFEQQEAVRPNIVQKWSKIAGNKLISFNVLVYKDNSLNEYSKDEWREIFKDNNNRKDYLAEYGEAASNIKYFVLDNYPGLVFDAYQDFERIDTSARLYLTQASIIVESYIFILQLIAEDKTLLNDNRNLFKLVANSVVFPDQYN